MRLTAEQWSDVFDYCFTLVQSLLYGAVLYWFGCSWWLTVLIVHHETISWYRVRAKRLQTAR